MTRLAFCMMLSIAGGVFAQPPQAASRAQDPATQFAMGEAFRLGTGIPVDRDQAIAWYRKAAAQGHTGAQDALGVMLFTRGERKQAIPLLQASAQRGDPRALYILGTAHFNGDTVPRDYPRAYAEMKRAAAAGLPEAQRNLAKMEPYLSDDDRAKAVALLAGRNLPVDTVAPPPAAPAPVPASSTAVTVARPVPMPRPLPVTPIAAKPAPVPATPSYTATPGRWRVQLGAYRSAGQAENQWAILAGRVPEIAKLRHVVTQAGEFWRLQADGIADRAAADALCRRATAAGGACFTVAP